MSSLNGFETQQQHQPQQQPGTRAYSLQSILSTKKKIISVFFYFYLFVD
jgi:hypothetical protein